MRNLDGLAATRHPERNGSTQQLRSRRGVFDGPLAKIAAAAVAMLSLLVAVAPNAPATEAAPAPTIVSQVDHAETVAISAAATQLGERSLVQGPYRYSFRYQLTSSWISTGRHNRYNVAFNTTSGGNFGGFLVQSQFRYYDRGARKYRYTGWYSKGRCTSGSCNVVGTMSSSWTQQRVRLIAVSQGATRHKGSFAVGYS